MEKIKLLLSDYSYNLMDGIRKRSGLSANEFDKVVDWMIFRQAQLFFKAPKTNVASLIRSKRIKCVDESGCEEKECSPIMDAIFSELETARGRWGTGVNEIADAKVSGDQLITKMILAELEMMCRKNPRTRRYKLSQFRIMQDQIEQMAESCPLPSRLNQAIEKYKLDKTSLIYYLLLSTKIPNEVTDEKAISKGYIQNAIRILSNAMETFIEEADKGIQFRERLENLRELNEADITSFQIRHAIAGNNQYLEKFTVQDLNRYVKDTMKEEKDKF